MAMEISHIWLGRFPTKERYLDYVAENYSEDDDAPLNKFAEDQPVSYYDTDWEESFYDDACDLESMIELASYYEDYINEVIAEANSREINNANTFIIVDKNEIPSPKDVEGADYQLWYMGEYNCNTD